MNHLSLFSGIGGADLASEWAGFTTVGQVEWADYPTKVLEKHWPDVPRWRDIYEFGIETFRARTGLSTVDVISGGFPCQPFSVAGKRKGKDDNRFLWPQMSRVISELKPTWVIGENVNGFVNMELEDACVDLENQGYAVQTFVIPACAVGAWHERKRVFIVAYSEHNGRNETEVIRENNGTQQEEQTGQKLLFNELEGISGLWETTNIDRRTITTIFQNAGCELWEGSKQQRTLRNEIGKRNANITERSSEMVSYAECFGQQGQGKSLNAMRPEETKRRETARTINGSIGDIWKSEPNVGRVANGIPSRLDRLKCLGNAIVPAQIYPIFQAIADIEANT